MASASGTSGGRSGRIAARLSRISSFLENSTLNLCALAALAMCVTLLSELVARNFLGTTLIWSSEFATICFVWIAFLGSTVAARRREHFNVDLLGSLAPPGSRSDRCLELLTEFVFIGFGAVLLVYGIGFSGAGMRRFSFSLGIPQGYTMAVMPVSGALFLFYGLMDLLEIALRKRTFDV